MLIKSMIENMKEDQLSQEVLIPLFKEMGYKDVFYYHGGSGEKGKDIVFWESDKLGARKNFAVVVKSENISGQAKTAKGTAGEVATQIQQAFGAEYSDPITTEPQQVHECWVVTSKTIKKESEDAIRSIIKPNYERHVRFIDGEKLWKFVEKHLGTQTALGKLKEIQKTLNHVDTHYQPVINLSGNKLMVGLKEKFKGAAEQKPLKINFSLKFPETPEGMAFKMH